MKINLLKVFYLIVSIIAIGMSLRGQLGNPSERELLNPNWRENGPFELSPERGRYALTYTLMQHGSFTLTKELAQFAMPDVGKRNGQFVSLFAPAVSFIAAPGYWLGAKLGASQIGAFAMIGMFALLNSFLISKIVQKMTHSSTAGLLAGLVFLFATPAFAYATTLYQHHISTFLILTSIYTLIASSSAWALGLVWFLCAMSFPVDYPNSILMFPLGFYALGRIVQASMSKQKYYLTIRVKQVLTFATVIVPLVFFLWYNNAAYGNPLQLAGTVTNASESDFVTKDSSTNLGSTQLEKNEEQLQEAPRSAARFFKPRNLVNGLYIHTISLDRGLLIYAPVLLFGLLGSILAYRQNKALTVLLSSIATADLLLYSLWGDPWGGWAFGSRYLIPAYAVLAIFVGVALDRYRRNLLVMGSFAILAIYSVMVNTAGALSTSANPPQVQVLALEALSGKRERYSWDRNLEYLQQGSSKSFVYQTWLHDRVTAWQYYLGVSTLILGLFAILMVGLIRAPGKSTKGEV